MHRALSISLLVAALLAQPARAQSAADAGREVYAEHCSSCHGERLAATGSAPDLRQLGADERARFDTIVHNGKGQMPSWTGIVEDEQIDQIWAYIRSRSER